MFTGLVEETGELVGRSADGPGARLEIRCKMGPLVLGESIAVDGVCLTVGARLPHGFAADASAETLARTTLGGLPARAPVNLERAIALGARLGGHLVTGHVDVTAQLVERTPVGRAMRMGFSFPPSVAGYIAEKGSVCVNGVSLTVNEVDRERFAVVLVPHTREATSFDTLAVGGKVNIEVDLVARYVARLLATGHRASARPEGDDAPPPSAPIATRQGLPPTGDDEWLERLSRLGYL